MDTPTSTTAIEATYNIIKASNGSLTTKEIMTAMEEKGFKVNAVVIQGLIAKGYVKRGDPKQGTVAYVATSVPPKFAKPKAKVVAKRGKRKYTKRVKHAIALHNPVPVLAHSPQQIKEQAEREMASAYNAQLTLKNTVATLQFATLLDKMGPDQMLLMLAGIQQVHNK